MFNPLLLSPYRSRKYAFPSIPSFLPTQVKFYDPVTGQEGPSLNSEDNLLVTSKFNECGLAVDISGRKKDVEKAMALIRLNDKFGAVGSSASGTIGSSVVGTVGSSVPGTFGLPTTGMIGPGITGWTYITNPINPSRVLLTGPGITKPFSGSGVIFFEKLDAGRGNVILAKTRRGTFEDLGGQLDTRVMLDGPSTLKTNARKEAFEESQGLFVVENTDLERSVNGLNAFLDIADIENNALYRCYLVCVNTSAYSLEELFANNKRIIANTFSRPDYDETVELKRFPLGAVKRAVEGSASGNVNCQDTNGGFQMIRDRTADCLRALISNRDLLSAVYSYPSNVVYKQENNVFGGYHGKVSLVL